MYDNWNKLINQNGMLIQTLRLYPELDKIKLANKIGVSSPTLYKALDELKKNEVILDNTKLNPLFGTFIGISIGTTYCKVIFLHFDFSRYTVDEFSPFVDEIKESYGSIKDEKIFRDDKQNYLYIQTPESFSELKQFINTVFNCVKTFIEAGRLNILGIGISSTGTINEKEQAILQSHNLPYLDNRKIADLCYDDKLDFFKKNDITLYLIQNSNAAVIAEKYQLYDYKENDGDNDTILHNNMVALYLEYGVGVGFVLNNQLFAGKSGFAGEIGHIEIPISFQDEFHELIKSTNFDMSSTCTCGSKYCIDHIIRSLAFSNTDQKFRIMTSNNIATHLSHCSENAKCLGFLLGYIANVLASILNISLVILTGKLYMSNEILSSYIEQKKDDNYLKFNRSDYEINFSKIGTLAPAIGAAIYSYHKKCDIDVVWN